MFFLIAGIVGLIVMLVPLGNHPCDFDTDTVGTHSKRVDTQLKVPPLEAEDDFNTTYPLTPPVRRPDGTLVFRIAIVSDLDLNSKSPSEKNTWVSVMRRGSLSLSPSHKHVSLTFDAGDPTTLKSTLAQGGRAMELSDLKVFNGHLLTVDDRTGVIYRIRVPQMQAVPWVLLPDGGGDESKGFKAEWMTVKDQRLYVGGLGKEWTTTKGEFVNFNPMWVKVVTHTGSVQHLDWTQVYKDLRASYGIQWPGYMIHESAQWSAVHRKWFFLPRRASNETYNEDDDEHRASNCLLIADEFFSSVQLRHVTPPSKTRGFSAFQFVPTTNDALIVALKTEEDKGRIASYITVFEVETGKVLVEETKLDGEFKYEGIEFV